MDRRAVLGLGGAVAVGTLLAPGIRLLAAPQPSSSSVPNKTEALATQRWAMLIDVNKCSADCSSCIAACREENHVPMFGDADRDIHWIRKVELRDRERRKPTLSLPALCNHCEHPPCVHVCPTGASFIRKDGLVLIDEHRCIGCRYCIIACPYKSRSLVYFSTQMPIGGNPKIPIRAKGVVEKCTFCVHRIDEGLQPACVEACSRSGGGAMLFGDLNDPKTEISQRVKMLRTEVMREDLGLKPHVHYQGL
ncbi:MAG: 4Fe-4S dicluster domain-containing protein [Magnetococcales bacterium]|nr:4Fe-4S dicluster domain-containing protein [Magnetococcales bacterium]